MAKRFSKQIIPLDELHLSCLPKATQNAFRYATTVPLFSSGGWYLAGGTALALQVGHRQSVDLDFFTTKTSFNQRATELALTKTEYWETTHQEKGTLFGLFKKAKMSFIAYPFFVPKQSPGWYGNVRILQPTDIAVMKVIAISQRGRKRDFFDLYWCVKNLESLEQIMRRLNTQYPTVTHNYHHIIKSLVYFADAEADPTPRLMFRANWKEVKRFFQNEASELVKKLVLE